MSNVDSSSARPAEWTVMVFLNAKNNLEPFAFSNFEQMASIGSTPDVNLLVEFGRPKRHYSSLFGGWSKSLRFRVGKGAYPVEGAAVQDLGAVNMGSGAALIDFVGWARATYPAKRYMLVIWNHGQGWRFAQAKKSPSIDIASFEASLRHMAQVGPDGVEPGILPAGIEAPPGFRYVSNDDDTGDKLYNREIQDALSQLLAGDKLDIVAYDACLMAMVETAYAMRGIARYMVASEELEPGTGWNYARWLAPLVAEPARFDGAALARLIVSAYGDEYGDLAATTQSALDLGAVETGVGALSRLAEDLTGRLTSHLAAVVEARAACANYAPGYQLSSIDLLRFVRELKARLHAAPDLAAAATAADDALTKAVIANYASASRQGAYGSHGLSVYFPKSRFVFDRDPDRDGYVLTNNHHPVEFVHREAWSTFLHAYLGQVLH